MLGAATSQERSGTCGKENSFRRSSQSLRVIVRGLRQLYDRPVPRLKMPTFLRIDFLAVRMRKFDPSAKKCKMQSPCEVKALFTALPDSAAFELSLRRGGRCGIGCPPAFWAV
jgi:hypothetical protein